MADPIENATPDARRAERDRQRRMVIGLPRTNDVQRFLADLATLLLDSQDKTQDALLALVDTDKAAAAANDRGAALLRLALADSTDLFGRLIMAARFDVSVVNEAMAHEEPIPGVAPAVMRAVRAAHAARQEADRRAREAAATAAARAATQPRRPNYYAQQQSAASATSQSAPPATQSSSQQPAVAAAAAAASAAPRQDPRLIFPCHICNKRGHWKDENACKPEDIRANLARLTALANPGQLALPPPDGQGMFYHVPILL